MHRIDTPAAAPGNLFTNGNAVASPEIASTTFDDAWLNAVQENLCQAIEGAGLSLVKGDHSQLLDAINALIAAALTSDLGLQVPITSAPYSGSAGDGVLAGETFGTAAANYTATNPVTLNVRGARQLAKVSADVILAGDEVFWDDGAREVTITASGNYSIGVAQEDRGASTTTIVVVLAGTPTRAEP